MIATFVLAAFAGELRIEGFGGYRFGMTLEEAAGVREDDVVTDCAFQGVFKCLEFEASFYGEAARVIAQIDATTRKLAQVVVQFDLMDRTEPDGCSGVVEKVLSRLTARYGTDHVSVEKSTGTWYPSDGGSVSLTNLCVSNSSGIVAVTYRPGESL